MSYLYMAVLTLGGIALIAAIVLYICSRKFAVREDERIGQVASLLPQANCGGCGYPGCAGFASALVKAIDGGSAENMSCPVGGASVMQSIYNVLGVDGAQDKSPEVAVIRCSGTCDMRPSLAGYSGLGTCAAVDMCGAGESACGYGCLGEGDCVSVCKFGAIHINPETKLAEVDEDKCTGCGACSKACPRNLIELRKKGPKGRRVYVACMNREKGATAMKACSVSCISCGRCVKECAFDAISLDNNLAYIDDDKCRLCRKCEKACLRHAIVAVNFPVAKKETPKVSAD